MFLSSKDNYVHLFQSLAFPQSLPPKKLHIFKMSVYIFLPIVLSFPIFHLEKQNTQTAVHEDIHIHQNLFRKRTRGDEEVLLNRVCLKENMRVCMSLHLEVKGVRIAQKQTPNREGGKDV